MSKILDRLQAVVEADPITPEEHAILPRMRMDLDKYQAFHGDDVRVLLDIIDRLDRAHRAARNTYPEALAVVRAARELIHDPNFERTGNAPARLYVELNVALAAFDEAATRSLP